MLSCSQQGNSDRREKDMPKNCITTQEALVAWLDSLSVSETVDEFGTPRFFVEDSNGDWHGDAFDTPEQAQEYIEALRDECR
jgi:hypothetical protein